MPKNYNRYKAVKESFLDRDTHLVARDLLGMYLVRRIGRKVLRAKIIETEAYDGFSDRASHASRRKTERNKIMFMEAGRIYVYFCYGMHYMLNLVTREKEYPAAVLIRGVEMKGKVVHGPGRLTKLLSIDNKLNGKKLGKVAGLWVERGESVPDKKVARTARIGVSYAGPLWSKKKWRFVEKDARGKKQYTRKNK